MFSSAHYRVHVTVVANTKRAWQQGPARGSRENETLRSRYSPGKNQQGKPYALPTVEKKRIIVTPAQVASGRAERERPKKKKMTRALIYPRKFERREIAPRRIFLVAVSSAVAVAALDGLCVVPARALSLSSRSTPLPAGSRHAVEKCEQKIRGDAQPPVSIHPTWYS
ncbi:unnamed protein product [Lampetra fluviatilis]